jgi:TPR repeat protein
MYAEGRGVPAELEVAVHWFEQAARQNPVEGQFYLCLSYALGRGVSRDRVTAYAWCRTAEKRGSQDAKESLVEISKLMRRREIKKAEQLAASIAESLGARPPVLLDTPSSARAENHADSAS